MTLKEMYEAIGSLNMYNDQVAVLENGVASKGDNTEGVWIYACDCEMSGDYPTNNKIFIAGANISNFLGTEYKALKVNLDGQIFPVYDTWDGYQPCEISLWQKCYMERPPIIRPIGIKKDNFIYDF